MRQKEDLLKDEFDFSQMDQQSEDLLEIRYINKDNAKFAKTAGGFVSLEYQGDFYERVGVYRTFPFTDPNRYISIREPDDKAREIGIIKDLYTDISEEEVKILNEQMDLRYFTPVIEKIVDIKEEYGYAYFDVVTNYGPSKYTIHMSSGSVVQLSETRILITDLDGNRYEIPDTSKLTPGELKKLDLFL